MYLVFFVSGVDPLLDDKKAIDESLDRLSNYIPPELNNTPDKSSEVSSLSPFEKNLKKLNKKLREIDALKEKQASGVVLEQSQLDKLQRESDIRNEIEELVAKY